MENAYSMRAVSACMRSEHAGLLAGRPVLGLGDCLVMAGPDLNSSPNYETVANAGACVPELMHTPMIVTIMYNGIPHNIDIAPAGVPAIA